MRFLKIFRFAYWLIVAVVLFLNVRLYVASPLAQGRDQVPRSLVAQLNASRTALRNGEAVRMQQLFPEGYYFSYLFYGLTWVELAMRDPSYAETAVGEAKNVLAALESPAGKAPFPASLPPGHGMFYAAWKSHLQAGVVVLTEGQEPDEVAELERQCDALATAFAEASTPFLPSYRGAVWPCDSIPAVHAMVSYDRMTGSQRYADTVDRWLQEAATRLDPETGLYPHTASLPDGRQYSVARATSQVIFLRLLPDIDPELAKQQYSIFRDRYLTTLLGLPCLREYPSGIEGKGDIDSGPLIFQRSPSATVMMIGIAQIYGDQSLANTIAQVGEVVGLPWTSNDEKRYLGGVLPVGDMIVGYSYAARPWFGDSDHVPNDEQAVSPLWRWPVHGLSLLLLPPVLISLLRRLGKQPPREERSTETTEII